MFILFMISLFFCIYSYAVYPPLLWALSVVFRRKWVAEEYYPYVTIVISAYNEAAVIGKKIENALALEYPPESLEIVVSSDGSTDGTNQIVAEVDDPRVKLMAFERSGKTACLNKVVPQVSGDIVVFTDANSMFPSNVLKKMTRHLTDSQIGLVTGGTIYVDQTGKPEPTGIYAKLEKWTKLRESIIASCVGADGAIFALRKELYQPLSDADINDLVIPLRVVRGGRRTIMAPEVYCVEEAASHGGQAFRRQVRISTRTIWALWHNRDLFSFRQFGFFAFFLWSHKLLRLTMPFWFLMAILLNILLLHFEPAYWVPMILFAGFTLAGIGSQLGWVQGSMAAVCKLFLITGASQFVAWMRVFMGKKDVLWTPQR